MTNAEYSSAYWHNGGKGLPLVCGYLVMPAQEMENQNRKLVFVDEKRGLRYDICWSNAKVCGYVC